MSNLASQLPLAILANLISLEMLINQLFQSQGPGNPNATKVPIYCTLLSSCAVFFNVNQGNYHWDSLQPLSIFVLSLSKYIFLLLGLTVIKSFKIINIPVRIKIFIQIFGALIATLDVIRILISPFNKLKPHRAISLCWSVIYIFVGLLMVRRISKNTKLITFQGLVLLLLGSLELVSFADNSKNINEWNSIQSILITVHSLLISISLTYRQMKADNMSFNKLIRRWKLTLPYAFGSISLSVNPILTFQMPNFVHFVQTLMLNYILAISLFWFTYKSISDYRGRDEQELMVLANHLKVHTMTKPWKSYTIILLTVVMEWAFLSCLPWVIAPLPTGESSWIVTWPFKSTLSMLVSR